MKLKFGLPLLFSVVGIAALAMVATMSYLDWASKDNIFHCEYDALLEFPSGRTYPTNSWLHEPEHDDVMFLLDPRWQFGFPAKQGGPILTILTDGGRHEAIVYDSSHTTGGNDEYWIRETETVVPDQ